MNDLTLNMAINAQTQYLAAIRRVEALAAAAREAGMEPSEEMRVAYRALRAGVMDEAWESERPLILASIIESIRKPPAEVTERT